MSQKLFTAIFAVAILFFTSGCSTLADARAGKGSGVSRTYAASQEAVWKAIPVVLAEIGLPLVSENKQEGYILAQRGTRLMGFGSHGEHVAIFVESAGGPTKTRVEVVSKKAESMDFLATNWTKDIFNKLDEKLK